MPADDPTPAQGTVVLGPIATGINKIADRLDRLAGDLREAAHLIDTAAHNDRQALLAQIERILSETGDDCHETRRLVRRGTGRD